MWVDLFALTPTAYCIPTAHCIPTVHTPLHGFDLFALKVIGPHHRYLLNPLFDLFALTPTAYCILLHTAYYCATLHGFDLFALNVMVTTHICKSTVSWPFCTNTYCTLRAHCVLRTHCKGVWPFCTKSNSPNHPYLLSPLCQLTFLY